MHSRRFGVVFMVALLVTSAICAWFLPDTASVPWGLFARLAPAALRVALSLLLPIVTGVVWGAANVFPRIDPNGARYAEFQDTYWLIVNAALLFVGLLQGLLLATAFGAPIQIDRYAGIGAGAAIMIVGNVVSRLRPNWFIGIRTPWTLSSESVWKQTHRLAGRLLVAGGGAVAIVSVASRVPLGRSISVMAAVVAVLTLTQSYALWRREQSLAR